MLLPSSKLPLRLVCALCCSLTVSGFSDSSHHAYDDLNRLRIVNYANGTAIEYSYDEVGNRTSLMSSNSPSSFPVSLTDQATSATNGSAVLNGYVNPSGQATTAWFEWGTNSSFGNTTTPQNVGNGTSTLHFSAQINGVVTSVIHYFRAVAQNPSGTSYGETRIFNNTPPQASDLSQTLAGTQNQLQVAIIPIVVSDPDAGDHIMARLWLVDNAKGSLASTGGGSYDSLTGIWTITGTVAQVNMALAQLRFLQADSFMGTVSILSHVHDAAYAGPADGLISIAIGPPTGPFTVSNTSDSGSGSLRQAILDANANPTGIDLIVFDISGPGPHTITPGSALPTITTPVIIDGTTQPGFAGQPLIELNGEDAGANADGLKITAGNSTVRGLVVNRFAGSGIWIWYEGGNRIIGNFIGTDISGTFDFGNGLDGLLVQEASNNLIGGTSLGTRNIVSGNNHYGIFIYGTNATGNRIEGNYVGPDVTGTLEVGNSWGGILVAYASGNTIGGTDLNSGNIISGNQYRGIWIYGTNATGNRIEGNFVGTDITGTSDLGNALEGIYILDAATNVIGGTVTGVRNIVSGNDRIGIFIYGTNATGNQIEGNYVGTDVTGTLDIGNFSDGILIQYASGGVIGGTELGSRNVISGNDRHGIQMYGANTMANHVKGNYIGAQADGVTALGNSGHGVFIANSAANNTIGGLESGDGNIIAFNGDPGFGGVRVTFTAGDRNGVRGNSIFANESLGIDLGTNGVTLNDTGDSDTGANNLQNYPILTAATVGSTTTMIEGSLNSTPSSSFSLEFFANFGCDPSGNGEGQTFIGRTQVTTDSNGNSAFSAAFSNTVIGVNSVTATATDQDDNTSEFSPCVAALSVPLASFVGNPVAGLAPLSVSFIDVSGGTITNRFWDFGDGITTNTSATNIIHTYSSGTNTVRLTVSGSVGESTLARTNYIVATNIPPALIGVIPESLNFGVVLTGMTAQAMFVVTNAGGLMLTGNATITGGPFVFAGGGVDAETKLLLHMDGLDGSTNFTDSTASSKTVAAQGDAQIDTAQSKLGGASVLFDGTGDRLSIGNSSDWDFGTGDFTIDFWVRFNNTSGAKTLVSYNGDDDFSIKLENNGALAGYVGGVSTEAAFNPLINTWYHIAFLRNGATTRLFVDGTQIASSASGFNISDSGDLAIGQQTSGNQSFHGWIDELRVSKGIARWTNSFSAPTTSYAPDGYTKLLLHGDGAAGSTNFIDSSANPKTMTPTGNAQIDTAQSKFGGASGLFDGDGDRLTIPASADFDFGSGNFTIDAWVRFNFLNQAHCLVSHYIGAIGWIVYLDTANGWFRLYDSGNTAVHVTYSWVADTWYHLAIVRNGSVIRFFVNGAQVGADQPAALTYNGVGNETWVGAYTGPSAQFNGWIDEMRISKAVARWTNNFSPPTGPYAGSASNVSFSVPAFGSTNIVITFSPTNTGLFSNVVVFASSGGNSTNAVQGLAVSGFPPTIFGTTKGGTDFIFSFATVTGKTYVVQYKDSLNAVVWQTNQSVAGNGAIKTVTNSISAMQRFYRLLVP